jgi:hypothetical protein
MATIGYSQIDSTSSNMEQQLENLADAQEGETEDDSYLQQMAELRNHPIDINTATEAELKVLSMLSPMQMQNLLQYRLLLGKFIDKYELQAVPGWDVETIQKLLPFVTIGNANTLAEELGKRFSNGQNSLLARVSQVLEQAKGYSAQNGNTPNYKGSKQRLMLRYKYVYKNLLQYGLVAEKDAGEQLFKGSQQAGFDFYSAHLFARNLGIIKNLAIGDFTVNMGQGLTSWQSLGFRKSADAMAIKRQADVLRPYNSAGEYNFNRGVGITLQKNNWQATVFGSYKKASANAVVDSINFDDYFSSIQTSGYHRTQSEIADKSKMKIVSIGGNITYQKNSLHLGINAVSHQFSKPLVKGNEPYNAFATGGSAISNFSVDYGYTYKNVHVFGELAADAQGDKALLSGLMASLDAKADVSLVYRNINKGYSSLYSSAFTESTTPINENGLYAGLTIKPAIGFKIDMYADAFSFPWLKFRVDAPSTGADYLIQATWKPNKEIELYTRFGSQSKGINQSGTSLPMHVVVNRPKQNWRTQLSYKLTPNFTFRTRAEVLWLDAKSQNPENGFLMYTDFLYKPKMQPFAASLRLQYFETDSYDSRMYAYENDVLYSYSIPPFYEKGYRYYLNINYDITRKISTWFRIAQTINPGKTSIGSGNDEIAGNRKTEVKLQVLYNF